MNGYLSGEEIIRLSGHSQRISSVSFSPDGRRLVTGSFDGTVKVWNACRANENRSFVGHERAVTDVAVSPKGHYIASSSMDGVLTADGPDGSSHNSLKLWATRTGSEALRLPVERGGIRRLAMDPRGGQIIGVRTNGYPITMWSATTGAEIRNFSSNWGGANVTFSPDGRYVAANDSEKNGDHRISIWDAIGGDLKATFPGKCFAFSPCSQRIVSGGGKARLALRDAHTGSKVLVFNGRPSNLSAVAFSPNGDRMFSFSDDGFTIWDVETGSKIRTIPTSSGLGDLPVLSPDGRRVISRTNGDVKMFDAETGVTTLTLRTGDASCMAFSPGGACIVTGGQSGKLEFWDTRSAVEVLTIRGSGAYFSHDSRRIVSWGGDKIVRVWDPKSGREILSLVHEEPVWTANFTSDGRYVVSQSTSGVQLVWDAVSGQRLNLKFSFEILPKRTVSSDGFRRINSGWDILYLIRINPDYDPWAEDSVRRAYWDPIWSAEDADYAEESGDWFATVFHLRGLLKHDDKVLAKRELPNRAVLEQRLDHALAEWKKSDSLQPAIAEKSLGQ